MENALKEAREKAGYTVNDISEELKIRKQYIIDLENNNLDALPGKIYIEGYQKMYYKFLGLELPNKNDTFDAVVSNHDDTSSEDNLNYTTFFKKSYYLLGLATVVLMITIFSYKSITTHRRYNNQVALTEFNEKQYERN